MVVRAKTGLAGMFLAGFLAVSSVGLVSGCATGDKVVEQLNKAQYVAQMNQLIREMKAELKLGAALIRSGSLAEAKPLLQKAAARFNDIVATLQAMNPPAAIKAVHDQFTDALVHFRDVVARTRAALQNGDFGALLTGGQQLLAFPQQVDAALQDYQAQGYAIHE